MAVDVVLLGVDGRQVRGLPDPAGGTFDAAGDFDELLDAKTALPVWSSLDLYVVRTLSRAECGALLQEVPTLLQMAEPGAQRRGLDRLRVMLAICRDDASVTLHFAGD